MDPTWSFGLDSRRAETMKFTINLVTPDNGERFIVEMDNATLTNIKGFLADKPDLTLTINRSDLELTMMGAKPLEAEPLGLATRDVSDEFMEYSLASGKSFATMYSWQDCQSDRIIRQLIAQPVRCAQDYRRHRTPSASRASIG
jgi:hypothetical protein